MPKKTIIEMMFNEPVSEPYEKLFYSPDKMNRLIVVKNDVGSYSYHIEKLTIIEGEEIYWCGRHSIWEPQFGNGIIILYLEMFDEKMKYTNMFQGEKQSLKLTIRLV